MRFEDVLEDADFLASSHDTVLNPFGRMGSDARVARQVFEDLLETFEIGW